MYHSLIIKVDDSYINTWDDWYLIPSSRPVIAAPQERTNFVKVPGRDGSLDYSQTVAKKPVFDDRTGKIEFYLENDMPDWDWETAYTTICETLKGKRVQLALEDNPSHYYEGLLWVNQYKSDKGHSKITLEYILHPTMYTKKVEAIALNYYSVDLANGAEFQLMVGIAPVDSFYRKMNIKIRPYGVLKILQNGVIRAVGEGAAVISVSCGEKTAACTVTVVDKKCHTVTRTLVGCTENNTQGAVSDGADYENTITAKKTENVNLNIRVKCGGEDITDSCVTVRRGGTTAKIKMESVKKPVEIEAEAVETALLTDIYTPLPAADRVLRTTDDGMFRIGKEE